MIESEPTAKDQMELTALSLLAEADGPIGSLRLAETWQDAGIDAAQATAGRFLRTLERQGYVEILAGRRGRVITSLGHSRLAELRSSLRLQERGRDVIRASNIVTLSDLLEVLTTRRVVEPEVCRLVALRAPNKDITRLQRRVDEDLALLESGDHPTLERSNEFHTTMARASGSAPLTSVALLLLESSQSELGTALQESVSSTGLFHVHAVSHKEIVAALADRDPERAQDAMRRHISDLVETVDAALGQSDGGRASRKPRRPRR